LAWLLCTVVSNERNTRADAAFPPGVGAHLHAEPVAVPAAAVAGVKREAAEAVEDRPAFVDFDRQRIVRTMPHHDVRAGIDRRVRDLGHIRQDLLAKSPVA